MSVHQSFELSLGADTKLPKFAWIWVTERWKLCSFTQDQEQDQHEHHSVIYNKNPLCLAPLHHSHSILSIKEVPSPCPPQWPCLWGSKPAEEGEGHGWGHTSHHIQPSLAWKGSRQHLFYHWRYCCMTGNGCYFCGTESLMSCLCFPHRAGKAVPDCKTPSLSNAQRPHYSSII